MEEILLGTVDRTILVYIPDPASTDGSGKTGLVAANLTVSYTRVETDNDVVLVDATSSLSNLSALTDAHADWGLKEVSSTLCPGIYRLDIADAVFASGAWEAVVYVMITSSAAAASPKAFKLVSVQEVDVVKWLGTALATPDTAGYPKVTIKDGTGQGEILTTSGVVDGVGSTGTVVSVGLGGITSDSFSNGAINAAAIAAGAIDEATFAADTSKYQARLQYADDNGGTTDRYSVSWFKNGQPVTSGITLPKINVVKVADGADLVAETAMTEIASLQRFRYSEATNRIASGLLYLVILKATIDGSVRTWDAYVSRDTT